MEYALNTLMTLGARPEPRRTSLRRPLATMLLIAVGTALTMGVALAVSPKMGLAVLLAVAVALALVDRPHVSVYLMVLVAPACAGLHRGLVVPGLRVSEAAILGLGILVLVFAARDERPRWTGVEMMLVVYAAATAVLGGLDLALRHASLTSEDLGTLVGPFQFVLLLRSVVVAMNKERYRQRAAQLLLLGAALVALVALAQWANLGPTRSTLVHLTGSTLFTSSLGEGVGRVTGPFNIWHELAGVLMPSVLLALAMLTGPASTRARIYYGTVFVLTVMALLASAAVGILIVTIVSGLYICRRRRVLHVAVAVLVPLGIVAVFVFGGILGGREEQQFSSSAASYRNPLVPQTLSYRYALFQEQSAPALEGHWTTGFGPDLPPRLALGNFPFAETTYVSLVMRGGIPLLVIFLVLTGMVIVAARREQRRSTTHLQWSIATVVFSTSIGYVLLQLIESYMLDSGPPHAYWAYVGLMLAAVGYRAAEGAQPSSPGLE